MADYPYQTPRHVHHPDLGSKRVESPEECEQALAEGYRIDPNVAPEPPADDKKGKKGKG